MKLKLIKASYEYKDELVEMIKEWKYDQETNHTNHSPWAIFRNDISDFDYYIEHLDIKEETNGYPTSSTFFALDEERNRIVGAVNIRHYLIDENRLTGGHIGDGIRPSERRKGYATAMIGLALDECKKLGIRRVLITCDADNVGSEKSIINNGGVFESEIEDEGEIEKRYWIELSSPGKVDERQFSSKYSVRKLGKDDIDKIYNLCKENSLYYQYCPPFVTKESIEEDLVVLPKNVKPENKYYVGYFDKDKLIAVMDLIEGYPEKDIAFVGFFMCDVSIQKNGVGTTIISELMQYFKLLEYKTARLAWVKGNPQAEHFWKKNGFVALKEMQSYEKYKVILAERKL